MIHFFFSFTFLTILTFPLNSLLFSFTFSLHFFVISQPRFRSLCTHFVFFHLFQQFEVVFLSLCLKARSFLPKAKKASFVTTFVCCQKRVNFKKRAKNTVYKSAKFCFEKKTTSERFCFFFFEIVK